MHDEVLFERQNRESTIGLATVIVGAGVAGMLIYIGSVAYAIGSEAVKNRAKITYTLDVKTDHEPGQEERLVQDVLLGKYGRHPAGSTVKVEILLPANGEPSERLLGETTP